jgi:hypothetical protein
MDDELPPLPTGTATSAAGEQSRSGAFDDVAAVLWLPDPEQRRGFREYYVYRPKAEKPGSLGFRK